MPSAAVAIPAAVGIYGANKASSAARSAASTGAAGQVQAAEIAAESARFKPYNITTALGGVRFGDQTADITYNPALARYRDQLFGLAGSTLPEDIRAAEEAEYQRLVAGSRGALEQQTAQLGTGLFRTGRQGLDIYGANPEMRAFAAGLSDRELALRQAAEQQIANRIAQSTGLFTSGVGVEQALMQPLEIGAGLGGRQAQAGAVAGQLLGTGLSNAARTQMQGDIMGSSLRYNALNDILGNRQIQQGIQGLFGNMYMPNFNTASIYNTNPFSQQTAMLAAQDAGLR
jgi:hypothetical protein